MAKISIITVVRNDEKHIEQTIRSVLDQTFTDYEYLVIDGASTDGTLDIIKKYEDRLTWISEPDKGIYDAMNKGLRMARGEYVLFLNSGDSFFDGKVLEKVFSSAPDADVYYGDTVIVDESGQILGSRRLRPPGTLDWRSFRKGMLVSHQAFIPKRALCPEYDLRYKYSADFDWTIKVLKKARKTVNTGIVIVKYLDGGVTKKHLKESLKERFRIMAHYYGFVPTVIRHIGFALRLTWFYLRKRWF